MRRFVAVADGCGTLSHMTSTHLWFQPQLLRTVPCCFDSYHVDNVQFQVCTVHLSNLCSRVSLTLCKLTGPAHKQRDSCLWGCLLTSEEQGLVGRCSTCLLGVQFWERFPSTEQWSLTSYKILQYLCTSINRQNAILVLPPQFGSNWVVFVCLQQSHPRLGLQIFLSGLLK